MIESVLRINKFVAENRFQKEHEQNDLGSKLLIVAIRSLQISSVHTLKRQRPNGNSGNLGYGLLSQKIRQVYAQLVQLVNCFETQWKSVQIHRQRNHLGM